MAQTSKVEYLIGTEGNPDYVILHRKDGLVLGVKTLKATKALGSGDYHIVTGYRIRVAPDPELDIAPGNIEGAILNTYPDLPFDKFTEDHASATQYALHKFGSKWDLDELIDDVGARFLNQFKLIEALLKDYAQQVSLSDLQDLMLKAIAEDISATFLPGTKDNIVPLAPKPTLQ